MHMHASTRSKLICFITLAGLRHEHTLFAPEEGASGGGSGGSEKPDAPKTFTQEEVDAIVTTRIARETKGFEKKLTDSRTESAAALKVLEEQHAELVAKLEDAGKNGSDKDIAAAKREAQRATQAVADLTKERDAARAELETSRRQHHEFRSRGITTSALVTSKVLPAAVADATALFLASAQIEFLEKDAVSITVDGVLYDDANKATEAFLAKRPYLRAHPGGGAGTTNGAGAGRQGGAPALNDSMSVEELIATGLGQPSR